MNKPMKAQNVYCDLCKKEFQLTPEVVSEQRVTLVKDGLDPHEVVIVSLNCPRCGKNYIVIMDDDSTLPILSNLRAVTAKLFKQKKAGFDLNPKLFDKQKQLTRKLDFKRHKLAEKYFGSFYQLEDGTMVQLDYCYHAQKAWM